MICEDCALASELSSWQLGKREELHAICAERVPEGERNTWCDCQHKTSDRVRNVLRSVRHSINLIRLSDEE